MESNAHIKNDGIIHRDPKNGYKENGLFFLKMETRTICRFKTTEVLLEGIQFSLTRIKMIVRKSPKEMAKKNVKVTVSFSDNKQMIAKNGIINTTKMGLNRNNGVTHKHH